jgi:hypothetical protein
VPGNFVLLSSIIFFATQRSASFRDKAAVIDGLRGFTYGQARQFRARRIGHRRRESPRLSSMACRSERRKRWLQLSDKREGRTADQAKRHG